MAKNPMQKKAQNSFLLGMLLTLLITGLIIAFLFMQLTKAQGDIKKAQGDRVSICVLSTDVKSGQVITDDMVKTLNVDKNTVPSNSFGNDVSNISNYMLEDPAGNPVRTNANGELYLPYIDDATGDIVMDEATGEPRQRVIETTDGINYYYQDSRAKVELTTVPIVAKVEMKANTILTSGAVAKSDQEITDDLRKVEYNMIMLTSQLESGEYVDVRFTLPSGQDYIVTSHKQVEIPNIDGIDSLNTIWLNLDETELLSLSCAIVECYKIPGSKLYVTEYVEPGLQKAATATYIPDDTTLNLINKDPNCVEEAKQALFQRNNNTENKSAVRNPIGSGLNANQDDAADNVTDRVEDEIRTMQEERQRYLESLGGSY